MNSCKPSIKGGDRTMGRQETSFADVPRILNGFVLTLVGVVGCPSSSTSIPSVLAIQELRSDKSEFQVSSSCCSFLLSS